MSGVAWFNTYRLHGEIGHVPPFDYKIEYCVTTPLDSTRGRESQASTEP
jgi:hypothetical protein